MDGRDRVKVGEGEQRVETPPDGRAGRSAQQQTVHRQAGWVVQWFDGRQSSKRLNEIERARNDIRSLQVHDIYAPALQNQQCGFVEMRTLKKASRAQRLHEPVQKLNQGESCDVRMPKFLGTVN